MSCKSYCEWTYAVDLLQIYGSGIEVRIFRWAGFARPSENPYKFRTTQIYQVYSLCKKAAVQILNEM